MEAPTLDFMKENALRHQRFLGTAMTIVLAQDILLFAFLYPENTFGIWVIISSIWMLLFGFYCVFRCSHTEFLFIFDLETIYYMFSKEEAFRNLLLAEYSKPNLSEDQKDEMFEQHKHAIEIDLGTKANTIRNAIMIWQSRAERFLIAGAVILYVYVTTLADWDAIFSFVVSFYATLFGFS